MSDMATATFILIAAGLGIPVALYTFDELCRWFFQ